MGRPPCRVVAYLALLGTVTVPCTADAASYRRGDPNADGLVDISDPIALLGYLFLGRETPTCLDAGDVDDDGSLGHADPIDLLAYLFENGPAPPAPGPNACGPDPTDDALDCASFEPCPAYRVESTSPSDGEDGVAVTRETIIRFTGPVLASTLTSDSIYALFAWSALPARHHTQPNSSAVETVILFYDEPLAASALITLFVEGDLLVDDQGRVVDADGSGELGGLLVFEFATLSLTPVPDTSVCGRVFASEYELSPEGEIINIPLEGATITVDGIDPAVLSAATDATGSFRLEPVPAGRFFVHVDGRSVASALIDGEKTATTFPAGPYYPFVGKTWASVAGQETLLDDIYLPLVAAGALVAVSLTEDTTICFPDCDNPLVTVVVAADSLYADDGTRGGSVGIATVDPTRLPGPLPLGLTASLVITVQTDGASNVDRPIAVCMPNLPDPDTGEALPPGAEAALWSFNLDVGEWQVVGSMTVSEDGTQICTDPGVGILAPGWHLVSPGTSVSGGEIVVPPAPDQPRPPPAPPAQEPVFGDADAHAVCKIGGKIYLHSGEESLTRVDLVIPGRAGHDFVMQRRYRSRLDLDGPLGHGWDHDYNQRLYPTANGDIVRSNGKGHVDTWPRTSDGGFGHPRGFFSRLGEEPTGEFRAYPNNPRWLKQIIAKAKWRHAS